MNEDEIMNIANLLRENDNFNLHTISSEEKFLMEQSANMKRVENRVLPERMFPTEENS